MSSGYSSRDYKCPFFRWDKRGEVHCEGGTVTLHPKELRAFVDRYCCSYRGYHDCPIALALFDYYERKEQENEKRG